MVSGMSFDTEVVERVPKILTVLDRAVIDADASAHVEVIHPERIRVHGAGCAGVTIYHKDGSAAVCQVRFHDRTSVELAV